MNILRKILTVLFNPLSVIRSEKASNNRAEFFAKYYFIIVIIAILVTAFIIYMVSFSGLF